MEKAGADVALVDLAPPGGTRLRAGPRSLRMVASGRAVPETLAWSRPGAVAQLRALHPDCCVFLTLRAFDDELARIPRVAVLDYVDALSDNYAGRSRIGGGALHRAFYRVLAASHRASEHARRDVARRTVSGFTEAALLGAEWVPTTALDVAPLQADPDHDLIMAGSLAYPPNVDAVRWLDALWPRLQARRPGTTLLLAGRSPTAEVRTLAALHGWTLVADFAAVEEVYARGRLSLAPIRYATGNQTKVIDAASLRVAQVVTPKAREGVHPEFPLTVASDDAPFVDAVVAMLDDAPRRAREADAAYRFVREWYSSDRWAEWARAVIGVSAGGPKRQPQA